jgi:hypothetical protein
MPYPNLPAFLTDIRSAPVVPRPLDEDWSAMIARTSREGVVCAIDEATYDYFLEVLPPRYMGQGFAFAEGAEPLRLFWMTKPDQFFCRQLTWDETKEFCRLAHISLPS